MDLSPTHWRDKAHEALRLIGVDLADEAGLCWSYGVMLGRTLNPGETLSEDDYRRIYFKLIEQYEECRELREAS